MIEIKNIMSSIALNTILGPPGGLKITNNLTPCYAKMTGNNANTISLSSGQTVILPSLAPGSSGVTYSTSTGLATILISGLYEVSVLLNFSSSISSGYIEPLVNGAYVSSSQGRLAQSGSSVTFLAGTNIYNLTSGQTFGIQYVGQSSATLANNAQDTFWLLRKVA